MKNIIQSKTTQNQVAATGGLAAVVVTVLQLARSTWPDSMPWGPDGDAAIVGFVSTVIAPLLSRALAGVRDPWKLS